MADSFIEHISLFKVSKKDEGTQLLYRKADIENGILKEFRPANGDTILFSVRILNESPNINGAFGIWKWHEISGNVKIKYAEDLQAIEIIMIPGTTIEKLPTIMSGGGLGIGIAPICERFMLCLQANNPSNYEGILCSVADFSVENKRFVLKDSVTSLPLYSFSSNDTIIIDRKVFYKKLECGKPVRNILIKEPMEIVRELILQRILPPKQVKYLEKWKNIRDFIAGIPSDTIYQEVASACLCSEAEAKSYIDSFLSQAGKYISDEDSEGIISAILENYPGLRRKTEEALSESWREKHQAIFDEAEKEIEKITSELEAKKNELSSAKSTLDELHKRIQSQEKIAEDVCMKVQKRISDARKDAANFIAEMSFMNPSRENLSHTPIFYSPGKDSASDDTENIDGYKKALYILSDDLNQAGVAGKYAQKFAAFLYSAYINRVPIFMAGPNGEDIADAFSLSLFGKTAGVADCSVSYFSGFEREITAGNDDIFIVKHAFRSEWITHIPDFKKFHGYHFIVHPFAEDLVIEPKSLFTYAMPLFMELITDSLPKGNYTAAKRSKTYNEYQSQKPVTVHDSVLRSFGFTSYAGLRVKAVLDDFHKLANIKEDKDSDCLFALFPYAFITDSNRDSLLNRFSGISSELRKEFSNFIGEHDE